MLRLTGRLADGWVPSMGYAPPPALRALIELLDVPAGAARPHPAAIKRIYNIFGTFGSGDGLKGVRVTGPSSWPPSRSSSA
jgi:hypothetical protein